MAKKRSEKIRDNRMLDDLTAPIPGPEVRETVVLRCRVGSATAKLSRMEMKDDQWWKLYGARDGATTAQGKIISAEAAIGLIAKYKPADAICCEACGQKFHCDTPRGTCSATCFSDHEKNEADRAKARETIGRRFVNTRNDDRFRGRPKISDRQVRPDEILAAACESPGQVGFSVHDKCSYEITARWRVGAVSGWLCDWSGGRPVDRWSVWAQRDGGIQGHDCVITHRLAQQIIAAYPPSEAIECDICGTRFCSDSPRGTCSAACFRDQQGATK